MEHVASADNPADYWSRLSDESDWKLNPALFRGYDAAWGPHVLDLFGTGVNSQLPRFCSAWYEPGSFAVDALALGTIGTRVWGTETTCPSLRACSGAARPQF